MSCRIAIARPAPGSPRATTVSAGIAALLGVGLSDLARSAPGPGSVSIDVAPGSMTVVAGPSGSGKSTVLRALADACAARGIRAVSPPRTVRTDRPVCDLCGREPGEAMRVLGDAGVGDARSMVCSFGALSEGQRARVRVALGMRRAQRIARTGAPVVLVVDEFGSNLDGLTARSVAVALRRAVGRGSGFACVVATSRDDVAEHLAPAECLELDGEGRARARRVGAGAPVRIVVRRGTRSEYEALAPVHYRPGRPATIERVLSAVDRGSGALAGVVVVSRPVVHAAWRDLAWPGRYTTGTHARRAARVNREIRCISRVIVDPRFRAMGVAERLVRAYLRSPATVCTEAVAAMGRVSRSGGFFARAGMVAYHLPVRDPDARLSDALEHMGIGGRDLADTQALAQRLRAGEARFLAREARMWAAASGRTAPWRDAPVAAILARAARSLAGSPMAFAHTSAGARHRVLAA